MKTKSNKKISEDEILRIKNIPVDERTSFEIWKLIFNKVWDGTDGSPEDINYVMNLVERYKEQSVLESNANMVKRIEKLIGES
jgi:hypothetical protein